MPHRSIGVFDSGLGGISILKEIRRQLPQDDLLYVADSAYAPYGEKDEAFILERSHRITEFFLQNDVKAMVIACNTATAYAVDELRRRYPKLPIVAIEPGVKPAVKQSQKKRIGIFATPKTIQSLRLNELIEREATAKGVDVVKQACPHLVSHVEAGDFDSSQLLERLQTYLRPMFEADVDKLVLGCTHYPFLSDAIRQLVDGKIQIVETSQPVTSQLKRVLHKHDLHRITQQLKGQVSFYTSHDELHQQQQVIGHLFEESVDLQALPEMFRR